MAVGLVAGSAVTRWTRWDRLGPLIFRSLHGPPKVNEYSAEPLYPPIPNFKNEDEKETFKAKEMVKSMNTVEEKHYQINRPKYYGWYSYILKPDWIPFDARDFVQFATCTRVVEGLPAFYDQEQLTARAARVINEIGPSIERALINEICYNELGATVTNDRVPLRESFAVMWEHGLERELVELQTSSLVRRIHEIILAHLARTEDHLANASEDYAARNEAFWFRGGILPDKAMIKKKEGTLKAQKKRREKRYGNFTVWDDSEVMKEYARCLQVMHSSLLQIRSDQPLAPFVERDSELCTNIQVPEFKHDPRILGIRAKCQHGTNIPGYWPEENNQLGLLAYHSRENVFNLQAACSPGVINEEVLRNQDIARGILGSFSWLLAQACNLGFSPLTELTFPLATQSVSTDGQSWAYYAYQLNTVDLSMNSLAEHSHQNILWASKEDRLYTSVENGRVVGFNPDCLQTLIKMYLNKPEPRAYSLTPYLGEIGKVVDFPDTYQRKYLLQTVRDQTARREKKMKKPEIYLWEKIFQIDHNTMPHLGLRRRRWWQMAKLDFKGKEHWHPEFVSTDPSFPKYIPKGYREPWQRKGELNRRYSKYAPKLQVPLKDKLAVYEIPDPVYKDED